MRRRRKRASDTSFLVLSTLLFVRGVAGLIRPRANLEMDLEFVIPAAVLAMVVLSREARCMRRTNSQRLTALLRMCAPFGLGVLLPVLIFLVPYIRGNARLTPPFLFSMGFYYQPDPETQKLDLPRAGNLRVDFQSVNIYKKLIPLIQQHAGAGEIYAAPDCPQVYFLAGYKNPTRATFQLFEEDYGTNEQVLKLIDSRHIRLVVLNRRPDFSRPLVVGDLYAALMERLWKFHSSLAGLR
jgi:NADH:ubiquinone oxidoreductase subunit K